jgi:hypothetical protein
VILALIVGAVVFSSASNNTDESKFRATESLQWNGNERDNKHRPGQRVRLAVECGKRSYPLSEWSCQRFASTAIGISCW